MKTQGPLTCLLIIGILGLTTAQPRTSTEAEFSGPDYDMMQVIAKQIGVKCNENGGPTAFKHFKNSQDNFADCMSSVGDVTVFRPKIDAAAAQGELDTIFKEYCDGLRGLKKCMRNLTDTFALSCLEPEEKGNFKIINNIADSLLEFICHDEGDRIATFIAAGGMECIRYKQPEIVACRDETFGKYFRDMPGVGPNFIRFASQQKDCTDLEEFRACIVPVLETCPDPRPGNIVDSLLKFLKRETPCNELINHPPRPTPTDVHTNVGPEQESVGTKTTGKEELQEKSLVKQIEAAEAQVRAANAQERAALAQEQTAKVMEQVGRTWLSRIYSTGRYPARW